MLWASLIGYLCGSYDCACVSGPCFRRIQNGASIFANEIRKKVPNIIILLQPFIQKTQRLLPEYRQSNQRLYNVNLVYYVDDK